MKMLQLREDLLVTAGDRGVAELELALQIDSLKPAGGIRRYDEMKSRLEMRNMMIEGRTDTSVGDFADVLAMADSLLSHGPVQWVDAEEFQRLRSQVQQKIDSWSIADDCIAHQLSEKCTEQELYDASCLEVGLPPLCTSDERNAALKLRKRCLNAQLPADCRQTDVESARIERANPNADIGLLEKCASSGIPLALCTMEQLEFVQVQQEKCVAAGLPADCSPEILQIYETTTTTTIAEFMRYCSLKERTALNFGIEIGFPLRGKCNLITCSVYRFFNVERLKLFTALIERTECVCSSRVEGSLHNFTMASATGCDSYSCWNQYSQLLKENTMGGNRILSEESLNEIRHWSAECSAQVVPSVLPPLSQRSGMAAWIWKLATFVPRLSLW